MNEQNTSERGQTLIIIVLSMAVLTGFTALALDGGKLFADRRLAQNAADASTLAGGAQAALVMDNLHIFHDSFDCSAESIQKVEQAAISTAIQQAADNDFTIDDDISDHHGVVVQCVIDDSRGYLDKYLDIILQMTVTTQTNFAHLVFDGEARNEIEAIVRVRPRSPLYYGLGIVGLNRDLCQADQNGVVFGGLSYTYLDTGGIFSNGCLAGIGDDYRAEAPEGISFVEEASGTLTGFTPHPQQVPDPLPEQSFLIPPPDCSSLPSHGTHVGSGEIEPGIYDRIELHTGSLTLQPGLYCITGDTKSFVATGGELHGSGVTLYFPNGGLKISGEVKPLDLKAPYTGASPEIPGVAIYAAQDNDSLISLKGNSVSSYVGLVYAPNGDIHLAGESGTEPTFNTQFVGKNIQITGDANIEIKHDDRFLYSLNPTINLQK